MILMKRLAGGAAMTTLALMLSVAAAHAQETTAGITGQITDENGAGVTGATVTVVHTPTGTRTVVVTGQDGLWSARGLRVGGPYAVSVTAAGHDSASRTVAAIGVGDPAEVDLVTPTSGVDVAGIEVMAVAGVATQGPSTNFNRGDVEALPSISRDLKDVARINPFATIDSTNQDALSFVGVNNRFNQLTIDGIRQNDDFGLNNNGYPTQRSPISIDAVQSVQVSIAPYSVVNNGFLGGSINAVTRSGTNEFHGSIYGEFSNEAMRGSRVLTFDTTASSGSFGRRVFRRAGGEFEERNYGATLGGPIIPDRLFFFVSYDKYDSSFFLDEGPADSGRAVVIPRITTGAITAFRAISTGTYSYDPLDWVSSTPPITDEKWLARVDWNITDGQRLQLTFQDTHGSSFNGSISDLFANGDSTTQPRIGLFSNQYLKDEHLTTYTGQLNSNWSDAFTTEVRVGYKHTIQNRVVFSPDTTVGQISVSAAAGETLGGTILAGTGTPQFQFGTQAQSQPNFLDITVWTGEAIGRYRWGDHEFLAGIRLENQDILNIFGNGYLPAYTFTSIANFQNRIAATFALVGAVDPTGGTVLATPNTADNGRAAFTYSLGSIYAEDTWHINDELSLLYGLRYDRFFMSDVPVNNTGFATRNGFSNQQNMDGKGIFLPRIYARWRPTDRLDVSLGFGRFSNQGLNVWLSNPFANDGQRVTSAVCRLQAVGDPAGGPWTGAVVSSNLRVPTSLSGVPTQDSVGNPIRCQFTPGNGNTNVLDPNLSIANVWKATASIGYNADLGWAGDNWRFQIDYVHQENRDSLQWRDLRAVLLGTAPDGRPVYDHVIPTGSANFYDMMLTNASDGGHSDSIALSLAHDWNEGFLEGLSLNASYTITHAVDTNPMTSSIADSSYTRFATSDAQDPREATSDYEIRNKLAVNFSYDRTFWGDNHTVITMYLQQRTGLPFSYTFDTSRPTSGAATYDNDFGQWVSTYSGRQAQSNSLLYVPATDANGNVTATSDPRVSYAPAFDLVAFNNLLRNTGLIRYAGMIAPRNSFAGRGVTTIDLHFSQEIPVPLWEGAKIQAYMDIENFGNLLNNRWGLLEQYDFYRGVPVVNVGCTGGLAFHNGAVVPNITNAAGVSVAPTSCAGASTFIYQSVRNPIPGQATTPFPFINASLWQIKVGLRFRF